MPSLQDQLLKAGMIDKGKAQKIKKDKQKQRKQQGKHTPATDEAKILAEQARLKKQERDRQISEQQKHAAKEKEIEAQIKQLIEVNRVDRSQGELAYQFTHGKAIKKLYVTEQQQAQLISGKLAIVSLNQECELIPSVVADKIAERAADRILVRNTKDSQAADDDDPYADYQIPDDLMW